MLEPDIVTFKVLYAVETEMKMAGIESLPVSNAVYSISRGAEGSNI
jgi:hypothetical protein